MQFWIMGSKERAKMFSVVFFFPIFDSHLDRVDAFRVFRETKKKFVKSHSSLNFNCESLVLDLSPSERCKKNVYVNRVERRTEREKKTILSLSVCNSSQWEHDKRIDERESVLQTASTPKIGIGE